MILDAIVALLLLPFVLSAAYVLALTALAFPYRRGTRPQAQSLLRFAVVIPAHDEEALLPSLLESLGAADYPRDHVRVHVIADNCSDGTAAIARRVGATVHERTDAARMAKGWAIQWLLEQPSFRQEQFDAVVFIDADCVVTANIFRAFASALERGEDVAQAYYDVRDAGASATLELRQIAFALVHLLRPAAKMRIGASAGLKGTGMCFSRAAIEHIGWDAHGLTEDVEQHLRLLEAGMRVASVPEVRVSGYMGRGLRSSGTQHERWEAGRLHVVRTRVPRLLRRGLRERNVAMLDAAVEQLVPPISLIALAAIAGAAAGVAFGLPVAASLGAFCIAALALYVAAGIVMLRPRFADVARALAVAPWYVAWKAIRYARAATRSGAAPWVRTSRDETA